MSRGDGSRKVKRVHYILQSYHTKPLKNWEKNIRAGHVYQILDRDIHSTVLEVQSIKSSRTYITCPADPKKVLGIQCPYLHFTVKNLNRSVTIDVLIRDSLDVKRRFRALSKQTETLLKPFVCQMPLLLEEGWNEVVLPLKEYTLKAFSSFYVETLRVQLHATCRVQNIYFSHSRDVDDGS